jgi:hypothetical protein
MNCKNIIVGYWRKSENKEVKFYQVIKLFRRDLIAINYHDKDTPLVLDDTVVKSAIHWWQSYVKDKKNPLFLRDIDYIQYNEIYKYIEIWLKDREKKN